VRVVFLGAGASIAAGYPAGRQVLTAIEQHFHDGVVEENAKVYWQLFDTARRVQGPERLLWLSSNPEVVASYLDLCFEALQASNADIERYTASVIQETQRITDSVQRNEAVNRESAAIESMYESSDRSQFNRAVRARLGLLESIGVFFRNQHWRDQSIAPLGPSYLRDLLSELGQGDVVITTNYDSLAERVLLALGKWSPRDGYGFDIDLTSCEPGSLQLAGRQEQPLHDSLLLPTTVPVLKLHGSVGWRSRSPGLGPRVIGEDNYRRAPRLYIDQHFFRGLPLPLLAFDRLEPAYGAPGRPVIMLPTYMKRTDRHELQTIWLKAGRCFAMADEVLAIGSSLPQADLGLRVLLYALVERLEAGRVKVSLRDPGRAAWDAWRDLLGDKVQWDPSP